MVGPGRSSWAVRVGGPFVPGLTGAGRAREGATGLVAPRPGLPGDALIEAREPVQAGSHLRRMRASTPPRRGACRGPKREERFSGSGSVGVRSAPSAVRRKTGRLATSQPHPPYRTQKGPLSWPSPAQASGLGRVRARRDGAARDGPGSRPGPDASGNLRARGAAYGAPAHEALPQRTNSRRRAPRLLLRPNVASTTPRRTLRPTVSSPSGHPRSRPGCSPRPRPAPSSRSRPRAENRG